LDQAFAERGPVLIEALVDPYEPLMPPKMPPDYAKNFRKALKETPGHERIEENISKEPARTMISAE
jgi:pyruvate dehydrogenase (quinone)